MITTFKKIIFIWIRNFSRYLLLLLLTFSILFGYYDIVIKQQKKYVSKLPQVPCQVVQHSLGETCIPHNPQRIIVTDELILDPLLALDFAPVAAAEKNIAGSRAKHFDGRAEDIISIGKETSLNIERIVSLRPDLILGFSIDSRMYKLLSQISPTVVVRNYQPAMRWKKTFQEIAELFNRTRQAQAEMTQYQQRINQLRQEIKQTLGNITVSVIRFYASGNVQLETTFSFSTLILQDVGLSMPSQQLQFSTNPDRFGVPLSLERIDLLDADALFVMLDPGSENIFNQYQNSPLWQKLSVVQNNRMYTVNSGYWYLGNILAANAILDDVNTYLLGNTDL